MSSCKGSTRGRRRREVGGIVVGVGVHDREEASPENEDSVRVDSEDSVDHVESIEEGLVPGVGGKVVGEELTRSLRVLF